MGMCEKKIPQLHTQNCDFWPGSKDVSSGAPGFSDPNVAATDAKASVKRWQPFFPQEKEWCEGKPTSKKGVKIIKRGRSLDNVFFFFLFLKTFLCARKWSTWPKNGRKERYGICVLMFAAQILRPWRFPFRNSTQGFFCRWSVLMRTLGFHSNPRQDWKW
jgi:hypothetical protein